MMKSALALLTLLSLAAAAQAGFQITFRVGDAVRTVSDDGVGDNDDRPGFIEISSFTLTDSGGDFSYRFTTPSAEFSVTAGIFGPKYSVSGGSTTIAAQGSGSNTGKNISIWVTANDFDANIGEPARASANGTLSIITPMTTSNSATANYGAYYDTNNVLSTSPVGDLILSGTEALLGRASGNPDSVYALNNAVNLDDPFTSPQFSLGLYANLAVTSTTNNSRFSFVPSVQIEQVPEPSHTALPVGIAIGLITMRRRRFIR